MVDIGGTIVLVNAQTENVFGYEQSELVGQSIEILIPERYRGQHPRHRGGFFSEPRVRPNGCRPRIVRAAQGRKEFPVEISLSPLNTEGGTVVTAAISRRNRAEAGRGTNQEAQRRTGTCVTALGQAGFHRTTRGDDCPGD